MLVYSSFLTLRPQRQSQEIVEKIATWLSKRCRAHVDAVRLFEGIRDLQFAGGYHIQSRATLDEVHNPIYPYLFCVQLTHADDQVSGRRWSTEIGLSQESESSPIHCSFLLKTDEVSAKVTSPIQVTRPLLVEQLASSCNPSSDTPGLRVKRLDEESASAFLIELERQERRSPIVIVSANRDGKYSVTPDRMRSILVGIADVVEVPLGVNTYAIEKIIGRQYSAWGGAINIVFQSRRGERGDFCETKRYRQSDIESLSEDGKNIESEILAAVTHRTNLPYSWRHFSLEVVNQAILRGQLSRSIQRAQQSDGATEYVELLIEADKEIQIKGQEIVELQLGMEERDSEIRKLQSEIDSLKYALSGRQSASDTNDEDLSALTPLRSAVTALVSKNPTLEQSLTLISALFPDRIIVLENAYDSAQESRNFKYCTKAFDLLWNLVNGYWEALASGKGDMHAKTVFGHNAYAQNEGDVLSSEGKKRRTFIYRGRDIEMFKHLKIGVKDSIAETLRIHFEWMPDEKRIVIGHCGKHLDP